ncbi:MAG: DUF5131 family protein [Candidatus Binatia bacterium]|nr:DUF5131 family protein [Candidatus Binatia bacterium]
MIDISKGRYWDLPWSLISSCSRCSEGCRNCWALAMEKRFHKGIEGKIITHPERLSIPLKRKKPTVYAVWNDWCHEAVPFSLQHDILRTARSCERHTFLLLTKRVNVLKKTHEEESTWSWPFWNLPNVFYGLTVCNQQEMEDKSNDFFNVPGNKFMSLEPLLSKVIIPPWVIEKNLLSCVICGGETGPGARPTHPDWVRSVRDQCAAAEVPFFFKQWGEWVPGSLIAVARDTGNLQPILDASPPRVWIHQWPDGLTSVRVGKKAAGRLLDGRTHNELPWVK